MKTLIVDDDASMLLLLTEILRGRGHDVTACADAENAWEAYQQEAYPLVVLDWLLPGMDGVQLCRRMRALPHGDRSVILMVTGRDQAEDLQAVLEAGADDYLAKPLNIDLLEVRLTIAERQVDALRQRKQAEADLAAAREQEIEIGARIQQTLLQGQQPDDMPGLYIAALALPSQKIDGDFYDFFRYHDQHLDVLVGDVMGKGIPAALLGAATKSQFLRALSALMATTSPSALPEPADIVAMVHAKVTEQLISFESFVTACYARFDLPHQRLDFVDCGHTKVVHCQQRTGTCRLLRGSNMPLGFSVSEKYRQETISFAAGDVFVFYSDGITEAQDEAGEMFGEDRLIACVQQYSALESKALLQQLWEAVCAFTHTTQIGDDLTCVVIKIAPEPDAHPMAQAVLTIASQTAELSRLRAFVRQVYQEVPPAVRDEEDAWQLELAVNEAASNIMRHAYHGRTDQQIQVHADVFGDRIRFRLVHWGSAFEPTPAALPAFDGVREGGFGLYLIDQLVDEVRYAGDAHGRQEVCLIKHLRGD
jgi:sigma-B regulation protein RsbU (phosphoserine phosphatase)